MEKWFILSVTLAIVLFLNIIGFSPLSIGFFLFLLYLCLFYIVSILIDGLDSTPEKGFSVERYLKIQTMSFIGLYVLFVSIVFYLLHQLKFLLSENQGSELFKYVLFLFLLCFCVYQLVFRRK